LALRLPGLSWLDICNRNELVRAADGGRSRVCEWQDTSLLTVCRIFPEVGSRLLVQCRKQWPIHFSDACMTQQDHKPDVAFIIAFRGVERLPQLKSCLATLRAQRDISIEIILVEQSWQQLLNEELISGVRHIHARSTTSDMPFNKSWALNVGARHASADILIFHDADILAPTAYAKSIVDIVCRGYQVARIPRLVFYLDKEQSSDVQDGCSLDGVRWAAEVRENCRGISLAIVKPAYWDIGGHDEAFYGWGGEDDEILQRAETLNFYPGGFMPFVHLWHPEQKEKHSGMHERENFSKEKMNIPVVKRISKLKETSIGDASKPSVRYK